MENVANFFTDMQSLFTLLSFATFMGIVIWAWSGKRRQDFEEAASLPFMDEQETREGMHHG